MTIARLTSLPRRARSVLNSLTKQHAAQSGQPPRNHLVALPSALHAVWQERRDIITFLRSGDDALAHDLRRRFGLGALLDFAQDIPLTLFAAPDLPKASPAASVIVPIHDAPEVVDPLLANLLATLPRGHHVVLVDDGSRNARIPGLVTRFASDWPSTSVVTQKKNGGFIAAVNAAFERVPSHHHVIVLNTDTLTPLNWVPRLLAPFDEADDIASVTPLSNAAEILSVPWAGLTTPTTHDIILKMDDVAQSLTPRRIDLPTGIGFCMALNRRYLDLIGGFDPAFGRGYGEEVDWCQKARALGGRHVVATNLVVGHHGGASFGATAKRARIAKASQKITMRYPRYAEEALDWEQRDPIRPERLAVALAWAGAVTEGPVPIFVGHALGGGAETALQREIDSALGASAKSVVVLRVGGPKTWRVELTGSRFTLAGDVSDTSLLFDLVKPLTKRHVIYSCGVHASEPAELPNTLIRLAEGHRLTLRFHDFYPISPSWNLIGADGRYRGVPPRTTDDRAHALPALSHADWRERWGKVVGAAGEVTVFSQSSAALVTEAYPEAHDKIELKPHALTTLPARLPSGGQTLGVLGGINQAKGGAVLERLAKLYPRRIAVIGDLDGRFHLPPPHVVTGRYKARDIAELARLHDVGAWLVPSICPETFSFATHEALATGLPVACFNLGAQAEAVAAAEHGRILDLEPDDTEAIGSEIEKLFADTTQRKRPHR